MKIFISTTTFGQYDYRPLELIRSKGLTYAINPYRRKLEEAEIFNILRKNRYQGLIAGTEPLTKKVLENAKSLKIISRVGVGLENIDLVTAKKLGIKVFNTPLVLIDAVAELTIGLILCCLRKITIMDKNIRAKIWEKEMGSLFKGKILGVIGLGKIGKRVAQLAKAFGARIIFYDLKNIEFPHFKPVSLNKLLKASDIISIHASGKEKLITGNEISLMKKGIVLINTSRAAFIDEESLYRGLCCGKIACAGLDVYHHEPYQGKLLKLDNVVLTPHAGSYARESRIAMEIKAVENLLRALK